MAAPPGSDPSSHGLSLESPLLPLSKEPGLRSEPGKLCIDDMLQKYSGEFGSWQLRYFVLTSLAWALEAFHTMVMIFADEEPAWRCSKGSGSGCDKKESSVCGLEPGPWEWTSCKGSSTVAQRGLFCGEKYKVGLVQALFFGGRMIAGEYYKTRNMKQTGGDNLYIAEINSRQRLGCILSDSDSYLPLKASRHEHMLITSWAYARNIKLENLKSFYSSWPMYSLVHCKMKVSSDIGLGFAVEI